MQKIAITCATLVLCISIISQSSAQDYAIPSWIKNNAKSWSEGQIGDSDFVKGIQYLIENNIMQIPKTKQSLESDQTIPTWIKNNAGWWSDGKISDNDFVLGIQYLVSNGIMKISTGIQTIECKGNALCMVGKVEKIVDGDTLDINGKRIRLTLVDTPEKNKPGFNEATDFTRNLCPVGSDAMVDEDDRQTGGSYGRTIAKVYCGGYLLNAELLYSGNAKILTDFCDHSEFSSEDWAIEFGC